MKVAVYDDNNNLLWSMGRTGEARSGVTRTKYTLDGTQQKIIDILKNATSQSKGELLVSDNVDRMADSCLATPKIENNVPCPR